MVRRALLWTLALWPAAAHAVPSAAATPPSALPLAEAREAWKQRDAAATLKALEGSEGPWQDRVALLQGRALLALGQAAQAVDRLQVALGSQVASVRAQARHGLLEAWGDLEQHRLRLAKLDAWGLNAPVYRWARAESLWALGAHESAQQSLRSLRLAHPAAYSDAVEARLQALARKGHPMKPFTAQERLELVERLLRAGEFDRAAQALEQWSLAPRERGRLRAELYRRTRQRDEERELLLRMYEGDPAGEHGDMVLWRLGRLAMGTDDNLEARRRFAELSKRFPSSEHAEEGDFLSAWLHYNDEDFSAAHRAMLAFADRYRGQVRAAEALWYAGWSAFLEGRDEAALAAFDRLLAEFPASELVPFGLYWTGRVHQRNGRTEDAVAAYTAARQKEPFSYYGYWSLQRLAELEQPVRLPAPVALAPRPSVEETMKRIATDHPVEFIRAQAFSEAKLFDWVEDELVVAYTSLGRPDDPRDALFRADLAAELGAEALAFRVGLRFSPPDRLLVEGVPWAWRIVRHVYPEAYADAVRPSAKVHGVEPTLVWSVMRTESHFRFDAVSPVGARGLMQMMPATARAIGRQEPEARSKSRDLHHPDSNVWLGAWYLARLHERYHGFFPAMLSGYNAGPHNADRWLEPAKGWPVDVWIERIPFRETRRYVRRVMESLWTYQTLAGDVPAPLPSVVDVPPPPEGAVAF